MKAVRHSSHLMIAASLFLSSIPVPEAHANISETPPLFLVVSNSPRASAMGLSSVILVDGQSALYNPGALGVYHLDRHLSISAPSSTRWLPTLADDFRMKTSSFSGGISTRSLKRLKSKINIGLGFAYSRQRLERGEQLFIGPFPSDTTGLFENHETADYYTGSLGLDYHGIKFGLGVTLKKIHSQLGFVGTGSGVGPASAKATAADLGLFLQLPITEMIRGIDTDNFVLAEWTHAYTLSIAYINANLESEKLSNIDAFPGYPLPHLSRLGVSLYAARRYKGAVAYSGRVVAHLERFLLGTWNDYHPFGFGLEVGLYNVIFTRVGRYNDSRGDIHLTTFGVGISTAGLGEWIIATNEGNLSSVVRFLANHVELSIDYAKYDPDGNSPHPLDNTEFLKAGFTIR